MAVLMEVTRSYCPEIPPAKPVSCIPPEPIVAGFSAAVLRRCKYRNIFAGIGYSPCLCASSEAGGKSGSCDLNPLWVVE